MKLKFNIVGILLLFVLIACNNKSEKDNDETSIKSEGEITTAQTEKFSIDSLEWLIGDWYEKSDDYSFFESWKKDSNGDYIGHSYMITEDDTVFEEFLKITTDKDDRIFYIVSLTEEIGASSVAFKLLGNKNKKLNFYNPANDYPQNIVYNYITKDSIMVSLSGMINEEKTESEDFVIVRRK